MEQLRPYCPPKLLRSSTPSSSGRPKLGRAPTAGNAQAADHRAQMLAQVARSGEHDPAERLRNMDRDGVAADVMFHGSQNLNPLPFGYGGRGDRAEEAEGIQIYNRWLADFCSVQPVRHKGLAQLPGWDPEACVRTAEWAKSAGLGGVNLPTMRLEDLTWPAYTDTVWESLWSACEGLEIPLVNHGAADLNLYRDPGPGRYALVLADGPWLARRVTWWLMFGGVFERHPGLKFIITEQPGDWPKYEIDYLQSVYESGAQHELRKVMHRSPDRNLPHEHLRGGQLHVQPGSSDVRRPGHRRTAPCGVPTTRTSKEPGRGRSTRFIPPSTASTPNRSGRCSPRMQPRLTASTWPPSDASRT